MSGLSKTGILFPSTISQTGQLSAEEVEHIPFPLGTNPTTSWLPPGFTLGSEVNAVASTSILDEQLPTNVDLSWVQGDTRHFSFLATDVNWCLVDPEETDEDAPEWEQHSWAARVANPYIFSTYQSDHWVPAYGFQYMWWRQHAGVAEFDIETTLTTVAGSDPVQWATRVDLTMSASVSERILPGSWYRWDCRSTSVPDDPDEEGEVERHLRGRIRIITDWTF